MNGYNQFICGQNGDPMEVANQATSNWTSPQPWFYDALTGGIGRNDAGVAVNGYTALTHCPLWQGVNIIAGDLGQVPIRLVKDEFYEQKQHNAWQLLRVRPNAMQTPSVFIETLMQWALIWGNGVAWTPRAGSRITDLIPLRPDCLWPSVAGDDSDVRIFYHYNSPITGQQLVFADYEVIHIQGLTGDGIWGYPLWQIAKNTIGQGLALEKHGNKQFSNGARPGGVLEHPAKLTPDAISNLRREWNAVHAGADNAGKVAILWEGMKFNPISMSNVEAEWIDAIKLNWIAAACLLNLPAYKLNMQETLGTQSNVEEQNETYKQMTLTRWGNRMDQEFRRKLLTDTEWRSDRYCFEFDYDAFLRADIDTLTAVADRLIQATVLSPNEARAMIRKPPRPGGDVYENPATSSKLAPKDGAAMPNNGRPVGTQGERKYVVHGKGLIRDRLRQVLKIESDALLLAARKERNFLKWMDEFYGDDSKSGAVVTAFNEKVVPAIRRKDDVPFLKDEFSGWISARRERLLDLCSEATADELAAAVERFSRMTEINAECDSIMSQFLEGVEA